MAFYVGSEKYVGGTDAVYPLPDTQTRGAMLLAHTDTTGNRNNYFNYPGNTNQPSIGSGWRYRSIITHGFLAGGYKGSNPWRSVNKTWHATDITQYCGEQLEYAIAYHEGYYSDYNGYVTGAQGDSNAGAGNQTVSARTVSCNLHNGQGRSRGADSHAPYSTFGFGSGQNEAGNADGDAGDLNPGVVGGWNGTGDRTTGGGGQNAIGQNGYWGGGSANSGTTNKMHFGTEIMYTTTGTPAGGFTSASSGESKMYWSCGGNKSYMTFSNDSFTSWSSATSADGWGKYLATKWGFHYGSVGTSSVQTYMIRFDEATNTDIGSQFAKVRPYSEENCMMGQDKGYHMGQHDGQQNNHTVRFNYSTHVMHTMGAHTRPKGHTGQSSSACWSAASAITSAQSY